MTDISINTGDAPATLAKLVDQFCAFEVEYGDIPVAPDSLDEETLAILKQAVSAAQKGDGERAYEIAIAHSRGSFEFDYLIGKILFAHKSYYEAAEAFSDSIIKFDGYGESWFYLGIANYQMGLLGEAAVNWEEAVIANENHEDAKLLAKLAETIIENTHKQFNQDIQLLSPIVSGKGIDIDCGSDKICEDAIAIDSGGGEIDLSAFADGELDYVIARNKLELYADPVKTLLEFGRVLKPGGVIGLVVQDDNAYDTIHVDKKRLHVFTRSSLRNMVSIIPELRVVYMGTCRHRKSFYAILEKMTTKSASPYPYKRKVNERLAKDVSNRAEVALLTGVNDVASAACRKLLALTPNAPLPADPDALHPFPFMDKYRPVNVVSHTDPKVAVLDGGMLMDDWISSLAELGASVVTVPFGAKREITWHIEKRLREIDPDFVLTCNFHPHLSDQLANMNIPYVCWVKDVSTKDILWRRDLITDNTHIFHFSQNEVERYKSLGVRNIERLALAADTKLFKPREAKPAYERDINIVEDIDPANGYTNITLALRRTLMDANSSVAEKNEIFQWTRKFGTVMDRCIDSLTEWSVPTVWKEIVNGARFPALGLSDAEICFAIGDEISARQRKAVEKELSMPHAKVQISGVPRNYLNFRINIYLNKAYNRDGVSSEIFNVMACGGFLMTDYRDVYNELFEVGKDLVCFRSIEEARMMAKHYLDHPEEREAIAENGRRKVMKLHTLKQRWETILGTLRRRKVIT